MNRRRFLATVAAAGAAALLPRQVRGASPSRRAPCILLRGAWQTTNIGDIGHTPGVLGLIERYFPEAEVILWPGGVGHGAREFLLRHFPRLEIVEDYPAVTAFKPTNDELRAAWDRADFMLHGSGSNFGARKHLEAWHRATGKPYGVFGVSADPISGFGEGRDPKGDTLCALRRRMEQLAPDHLDADTRWVADHASFMFMRDSISLGYFERQNVRTPILEFGPDTQFAMEQRDDARGDAYRAAHDLRAGNFLCVIPRLRYTPYWELYNRPMNATDPVRKQLNDEAVERDNAKLRELIVAYVRHTGNRVMTCPEMTYQAELAKTAVIDPLPDDVKAKVVWRDTYWLPDEAAAIYARAQAVVSYDCHSPIIAIANGTPALYVRQPTDTCKGEMYHDLGLSEWICEVEATSGAELWARVKTVIENPAPARAYADAAMARARARQRHMMETLRRTLA